MEKHQTSLIGRKQQVDNIQYEIYKKQKKTRKDVWKQTVPEKAHLIDVLVSFDEVDREFPQWSIDRVSEARGDPPLEYGHIRQHL